MHKVDDLMAMQPSTSKEMPEDSNWAIRFKKLENSKVQTRSASSAKRKPASPRKRPTTLYEAVSADVDTGGLSRKSISESEEPLQKVKPSASSATSPSSGVRNECSAELSSSALPGCFPFACDLATLTGIQALARLSSTVNNNQSARFLGRRPDLKLEKNSLVPPIPNADLISLCPDKAKANALVSSNAAALIATINSLLLAGAVSAPDAQTFANPDMLVALTALGMMPFVADSATTQSTKNSNLVNQSVEPSLLDAAGAAAAGDNLFGLGSERKATCESSAKLTMQPASKSSTVATSGNTSLSSRSSVGKGHARRVKQKPPLSTSGAIPDYQKKHMEGGPTKKLFMSLQNEMPLVSKNFFFKEDEMVESEAKSEPKEEKVDLEELENFAQTFKKQRIKFGFTQGDVGMALGRRYGTDFSQTTISRFEALNLSFKNMCKLRPLLKEWLADAEMAIASGATVSDLLEAPSSNSATQGKTNREESKTVAVSSDSPSPSGASASSSVVPLRKRRKRTNLDASQRKALDEFFKINARPDHDKMAEIAEKLELDRDVIRVWFCNRRQKLRKE